MISGSSEAAAQATSICGSAQQQRIGAVDRGLGGDDLVAGGASVSASRGAVRTSRIAVTTAKQRMPSVSASAAISWRSSARNAAI